ncbi:glyoxylate/hydroxypyruvate reductase A isoform X2 [Parasteatoda tepidariorum]|uniref:glyoxylate/hydroxypyruvate reductase A isoform X2 n=1 Tax=Parasteatoda tepidariorum TaxID=114398 RepID=UPI001C726D8E|nr:glyoxylate/hydroxypyruvate reductase A isoform X2 [Parasteatoda tepidariorum]
MAACFSSPGIFSLPPIFVLSKISKLAQCLRACAMPQIEVKEIDLPILDNFGIDSSLTEKCKDILKDVEIAVCDSDILVKLHNFMPQLKWAHSTWAGIEGLLKAIPQEPPFTVTRHSGDSFTSLIAEYVVCHILNSERKSRLCWKSQESKVWLPNNVFSNHRSLNELSVGILGVGNMGSGIASFLKSRGTTVYGFARRPRAPGSQCYFDEIYTKLDDVLPKCDYLINVLPTTPLTSGLLNNSALEKCTKVVITPHVSALSKPEHIAEEFFQNLTSYIDGHSLRNVVNWSAGY